MKIFAIFLSFLVFSLDVFAECTNTSNRIVKGAEPLASKLYEAAKNTEMGAWKNGTFHEEIFTYLGDLIRKDGTVIHVTYVDTTWCTSTYRGTYRLIFFNKQMDQVGQYNSIQKPTFIGPNKLEIPYEDDPVTIWEFSGKLPECLEVSDDCFPLQNGKEL